MRPTDDSHPHPVRRPPERNLPGGAGRAGAARQAGAAAPHLDRPRKLPAEKTSRDITETAARSFATLADGLRKRRPDKSTQPQEAQTHADEVAHFLTQCLFCFFAEDVGLLPGRMFEGLG
ncbi:MAG: hypothetical protein Q8M91_09835 [Polaromonas sp.]|nr:hypothetical protein [Polaromonas sp.]